jgi:L-asparaginase
MNSAKVAIASLGGTITMVASDDDRVTPQLDAASLIESVPELATIAQISATTLSTVPSASLRFDDIVDAVRWAQTRLEDGVAGIVVAQGTDVLEEAAYLFDLMWDSPVPVVFTGAMRPPTATSADGSSNLLAATRVALSPESRGRGVLVVLNDVIHAASRVRKTHASALDAFRSPNFGPLGSVAEDRIVYGSRRHRYSALPVPATRSPRIALLESAISDSGELIRMAAASGHDGIALSALGVGHVSEDAARAVSDVIGECIVVFSTRTGAGSTFASTYGFTGSESDLIHRGAIPAGHLDSRHARVLLWLLLANGFSAARIRDEFAARGA